MAKAAEFRFVDCYVEGSAMQRVWWPGGPAFRTLLDVKVDFKTAGFRKPQHKQDSIQIGQSKTPKSCL